MIKRIEGKWNFHNELYEGNEIYKYLKNEHLKFALNNYNVTPN